MRNSGPTQLIFLHLSDIHFNYKWTGDKYDLDEEIRRCLEVDVVEIAKEFKRIDGILVSGDIAFAGKAQEYEYAKNWLDKLTNLINIPEDNVLMIAGNHDIDRDVIKGATYIYDIHEEIKAEPPYADVRLRDKMTNPASGHSILAPQAAYQKFASSYACFSTLEQLYWDHPIKFGLGHSLIIRGINSAILCSERDGNEAHNQLFVGECQYQSMYCDDTQIYLCMCLCRR